MIALALKTVKGENVLPFKNQNQRKTCQLNVETENSITTHKEAGMQLRDVKA